MARITLMGAADNAVPMPLHATLLPAWGEAAAPLSVVFRRPLLPATGVAFRASPRSPCRVSSRSRCGTPRPMAAS
jgi:hypothetical protein